jgi:hypothetical protein
LLLEDKVKVVLSFRLKYSDDSLVVDSSSEAEAAVDEMIR